jgi:uncharacterized protein (TIGR02300 family)
MAKLEWGQKRTCSSCSTRFYDMGRLPVLCPKCNVAVEIDAPFKVRRSSSGAAAAAAEKIAATRQAAAAAAALAVGELEVEEEAVVDDLADDADDSGLMEDASDLGEDDEDMAEVMEHMDENIEDEV